MMLTRRILLMLTFKLQVIIPNYSYILIQGTYLPAQDIMTYLQLLHTCGSLYLYVGT
jgi:hypothetical protein